MIDDFTRDLRYSARLLRKHVSFAAIVVITLALSIGATVTVFSIVDAWLVRPLGFPNAQQLVIAFAATPQRPTEPAVWMPYREYLAWKDRSRSFASLSAAFFRGATIARGTDAVSAVGLTVTPEFFRTFEVAPLIGRTLSMADVDGPPVVVLSHALWQRQFGASASVIGAAIRLSDVPHQIVGVMPREFDVRLLDRPEGAEFWTPFRTGEPGYEPGGVGPVAILGRLRPGVAIAAAQSEVAALTRDVESGYPNNFNNFVVNVASLQADNTRSIRATLLTVAAAVFGLLMIAAMNVATLIAGRGLTRAREVAVRSALGSGRSRLLRQFLTEGLLLSLLGGAGGLLLALIATRLFIAWNPLGTLPPNTIAIDLRALGVTATAMIVTTIACGLFPALRASRTDPADALHGGERGAVSAPGHRTRLILLTGQLAASLVLLVATMLLIRTFERLQTTPLGFRATDLTVANVVLPERAFGSADSRNAFYQAMSSRVAALPGVRAVAAGTSMPLNSGPPVTLNTSATDLVNAPRISAQDVSVEFFDTLQIPIVAGRSFEARDTSRGAPTLIVNARAATDLFGSPAAAIGRRVRLDQEPWREIVGVAGNVGSTFFNTLAWRTDPIVYRPAAQAFKTITPSATSFGFALHIRSDRPIAIADVRAAASSVNPRAAITDLRRATDIIDEATRQPAFRMTLLFGFAAISLLLATIGAYGLVSQTLAQRVRELAVRMALGARPAQAAAVPLRAAFTAGVLGVALGLGAALLLGRAMEALLYGVGARDPESFVIAAAALLTAIASAALVPTIRALRIDPNVVLRAE